MKLIVDTSKQARDGVEGAGGEARPEDGRQKVERGTGRPMWSTQVFVQDNDGGEVITVTTAGERPDVAVGQIVALVNLEALPWATNGRNGVAFRAESISSAPAVQSVKSA